MNTMDSRSCKAFTLVEIVVVLLIVAIIAAITFPVMTAAKKKSYETMTQENLHQCWLALEVYRQDFDNASVEMGTSSDLGLPNVDGFHSLIKKSGIKWWYAPGKIGYGPIYYPMDRSDFVVKGLDIAYEARLNTWLSYNRAEQSKSVIIGDFNHTEGCFKFPDARCLLKGFGIQLDGSLSHRQAVGYINRPTWWGE
jgi:prepilin-type N-terminal cleavage/methylation domain-containing protein